MVFSEPVFMFLFLPVTLLIYYAVPFRFKNAVLFVNEEHGIFKVIKNGAKPVKTQADVFIYVCGEYAVTRTVTVF